MELKMAEHKLTAQKEMKVLGVFLDEQLTGETQCANAAGKADRATAAVKRMAKHLKSEDKILLAEALALPHMEYCQNAFYNQSGAARETVERAYNRMARMVTGEGRSEQALRKLKWPRWTKRREAVRKAFVSKIYYLKEPEVLREMMPGKLEGEIQTRAVKRGELQEPPAETFIGSKQFSVWAPRVINEILQQQSKVEEGDEDMQGEVKKEKKEHKMPSDEYAKQRVAYYTYLEEEYSKKENATTRDEKGRIRIWTDGSARNTKKGYRAGAGVFYGHGNPKNRGWKVSGNQTNQRAELTALLRCIEGEEEAILICTDSTYVVKGVKRGRYKWKSRAWYKNPGKAKMIDNADLWQIVDSVLNAREEAVEVKWVKGHALPHHINQGLTTEKDIWGNNGSDVLAGKAAENM